MNCASYEWFSQDSRAIPPLNSKEVRDLRDYERCMRKLRIDTIPSRAILNTDT